MPPYIAQIFYENPSENGNKELRTAEKKGEDDRKEIMVIAIKF